MNPSFESIMEKMIPEINFLTVSGTSIRPGSVLESLEKDIEYGYLPTYLKQVPGFRDKNFDTVEGPYDIQMENIKGEAEYGAAATFMKMIGLKFDVNKKYKLKFEITDIIAKRFKEDIYPMDIEIALKYLRKHNRQAYRKLKGHFLVFKVLYANQYKVTVEIEKSGRFEADVNVKSVDVEADANYKKEENSIIVSHNSSVPFGVIGYQIKSTHLTEID
ncbi:MAG: hypothetical protein GXO47_08500 [Chlorobi bacterium]|nr:hypothetical protein [Chlorobiota bacterium]